MHREILTVHGMTCGHCQKAVEDAVKALPGVVSALADLDTKRLTVEFDQSACSLQSIKDAVIEEGFTLDY